MVKKLKYLLFIIPFLFTENVFAHPYQLTYNSFNSGGTSYTSSIQSNNTQSIVYNVPFSGNLTNIEWGTTSSPTCSSTAVVSGVVYIDNTAFGVNNNDIGWGRVYIRPSSSDGAFNCTFQVSENGTSYVCTAPSLSSSFIIGYSLTSATPAVSLNHVITRNVDINCDTSTGQIIQNQNSNTQSIINNNTQNSQNIINNQNQNTQSIINNQNQNTQEQIESQKVCNIINKNNIIDSYHYLSSNGSINSSPIFGITDYINITSSTIKVVTNSAGMEPSTCFYDGSKTLISCIKNQDIYNNYIFQIPTNSIFVRFTINLTSNLPQFQICQSGNQALNDSVNDLNDTLKSDTPPDTENQLSELDNSLISDTPITDLITLPITLLNSYITGVGGTCTSYNLGNLYGTDLVLPCLNLQQRLGSNLWTIIDSLFSIFMIYNIAMLMVQAFEGFTSLRDDYEGLYQPRHADTGYEPKHGGGN